MRSKVMRTENHRYRDSIGTRRRKKNDTSQHEPEAVAVAVEPRYQQCTVATSGTIQGTYKPVIVYLTFRKNYGVGRSCLTASAAVLQMPSSSFDTGWHCSRNFCAEFRCTQTRNICQRGHLVTQAKFSLSISNCPSDYYDFCWVQRPG